MYNYITNPITNRRCKVNNKTGKQIIQNYIKFLNINNGRKLDQCKLSLSNTNLKNFIRSKKGNLEQVFRK